MTRERVQERGETKRKTRTACIEGIPDSWYIVITYVASFVYTNDPRLIPRCVTSNTENKGKGKGTERERDFKHVLVVLSMGAMLGAKLREINGEDSQDTNKVETTMLRIQMLKENDVNEGLTLNQCLSLAKEKKIAQSAN